MGRLFVGSGKITGKWFPGACAFLLHNRQICFPLGIPVDLCNTIPRNKWFHYGVLNGFVDTHVLKLLSISTVLYLTNIEVYNQES